MTIRRRSWPGRGARLAQRWAAQEQQQATAEPAPAAPAAAQADPIERLKELGQLHESGVLTDQEFADAKAKILA
jgi:hypothetical protein